VSRYRLADDGSLVPADGRRPRSAARRYRDTSEWQRRRREQVAREPRCERCGHTGSRENPLTADHVVPLARGGDPRGALRTLCLSCNASRGNRGGAPLTRIRTNLSHTSPTP
jgi:5-methylcytosine-specific restriction endonuclease McrA